MKTARSLILAIGMLLSGIAGRAQQLRLGTTSYSTEKSAVLELLSDRQGLLLPRLTDTTAINALTPPDGMAIYLTSAKQVMVRANGRWQGLLTTIDTGNISSFYLKVRKELSAGAGISYNATTGVISSTINTGSFWTLGGNTAGGIQKLGTIDNYDIPFISNNSERMRITASGSVGVGVTNPSNPLVVKDTLEIRRTGTLSELLFSNTAGTGDFRIGGDGGDIFWQGGGGRNLQMGAYWGIVLGGDRQTGTFPSFSSGVANTGVLIQAQRDISVPLAIQANSASQTANLTEWRSSSGSVLDVLDEYGNLGVGSGSFNATYPEKLLVDAGTTTSVNAIVGKGTINNYLQLNIQNRSAGASASSDVVATADNGSETTNYVDMGINSSANSNNYFGAANDAYLYNIGQNLLIGTGSASKSLVFMTGGGTQSANERMRIDGNGVVGIATNAPNSSTKLDVAGGFKLGAKGTAEKNVISFELAFASNTNVPGGSMNILTGSFSAGSLDYPATIPAPNTPTTTRGSVAISTDQDLPANISIGWARVFSTSSVKVHFINSGTSSQTIPSGLKLYITITEF